MSPAEQRLWLRLTRRASLVQPLLAAAILRAFANLRDDMGEAALARAIEVGADDVFRTVLTAAVLEVALQPVRDRLRKSIADAVPYFVRDLPAPPRSAGRTLTIGFDILNPRVIEAVQQLESRVMGTLTEATRETVRQTIRAGLEAGRSPRTIARELRSVIGLAPNQAQYVANLRAELESGQYADAARRQLLDRRFNLNKLETMTADERAARIDTIVNAYRKSYIAFNAETNARTAILDALKLGQRLSWQAAIDAGRVDGTRVVMTWVGVMDDRERPSHRAMQGETVGFDETYSNGQTIPGDTEFNCRCISRYHILPA